MKDQGDIKDYKKTGTEKERGKRQKKKKKVKRQLQKGGLQGRSGPQKKKEDRE